MTVLALAIWRPLDQQRKLSDFRAPTGSITLAETRRLIKDEVSVPGNRLILYFGLDRIAFNNIDKPILLDNFGKELGEAMREMAIQLSIL